MLSIPLSMLVGMNHFGFSTLQLSNLSIVFLPPDVTSVVQPLDHGIIASFKVQYQKKLCDGFSFRLNICLLTMT